MPQPDHVLPNCIAYLKKVQWLAILGVNYNIRYDPLYEGSLDSRKAALRQSARYLRQFLPGKEKA